ncbi:MAG: hypothetical protein ACI9F9_001324 [Candidatus Paceibacteria bacterium]|jgi:hypothetical protein
MARLVLDLAGDRANLGAGLIAASSGSSVATCGGGVTATCVGVTTTTSACFGSRCGGGVRDGGVVSVLAGDRESEDGEAEEKILHVLVVLVYFGVPARQAGEQESPMGQLARLSGVQCKEIFGSLGAQPRPILLLMTIPEPKMEVDLHGCRPEAALKRLERALHTSRVRRCPELLVITGRGLGNDSQKPILREKVEAWLRGPEGRRAGARSLQRTNKGGALLVRLASPSSHRD